MNYNKQFIFSDSDILAVLHYIRHGNMKEAYRISRENGYKGTNKSLSVLSSRFFNTEKIQALFNIEIQKYTNDIDKIFDRIGMKNPKLDNSIQKPKQSHENVEKIEKLDKEQAKKVLIKLINTNKTDAKTVKDAMTLLAKLEAWDKEKPTENSNITFYELPTKQG